MSLYLGIESHVLSLIFRHPFVTGNLDISLYQATVGRLFLMTFSGTSLGCCIGRRPLCLVHFLFILAITPDPFLLLYFVAKERPELESRFSGRVQVAVEYARTIEDFNELIDPRTLAHHCLGPEPSLYVFSFSTGKRRNVSCLCIWDSLFHFFVLISCLLWCRDVIQV